MLADIFLTGQLNTGSNLQNADLMMFCCGSEEEFWQACAWRLATTRSEEGAGTPSDRPRTFGWILKHLILIIDLYGRCGWELERKASGPY